VISVLTTTYNRAHTLQRAIDSVRAQTCEPWHHIIVDDGSVDETPKVLAGLDGRYTCLRQDNLGFVAAANRAGALARGEYIAILDSDDEYLPHHLALSIATLEAGADLVWGGCEARGPEDRQYYDDLGRPGERIHMSLCCLNSSFVLRRSFWQRLSGFSQMASCDADFRLRLVAAGGRAVRREGTSVVVHCEGDDRLTLALRRLLGRDPGFGALPDQALIRGSLEQRPR
jgi:glycosyltransferase involved in cell wall biosynthesis